MTITNASPIKVEWSRVCAYVRRHLPTYRMRPGELRWIEQEAARAFSSYMFRGHDVRSAGEATRAEILIMFMRGIRKPECEKQKNTE